jgi:hypothetical protein
MFYCNMKNSLATIIQDPISDADIQLYLPKAKILTYNQLERFETLQDLLPHSTDFVVLLYQSSPNRGHWVCVTKHEGIVVYFDSYGKPVDHPLTYTSRATRKQLGETQKYLSQLFNRAPEEVVYNPIDYQSDDPDVNTCGRHCVFFILNNLKRGLTLSQYYQLMKNLNKKMGLDFDAVVSAYIPIV